MSKSIGIIILLLSSISFANTWEYKNGMSISSRDYNSAAKECYKKLTGGKYLGEEASLDIIDICANPKTYKGTK